MSIAYQNVGKNVFCPTSWANKLDLIYIPGDNNWDIQILTSLAGRNVLAYGIFGGVGVKLQVFSGPSHQVACWHTNICHVHIMYVYM